MEFKEQILTFEDDRIVAEDGMEVMMSWEAPIMERCAEFICYNKGDILEIGFGMGICSDYIQSHGVNSHTIVEIHPQIIEKLEAWASDKSNVTIMEGDWHSIDGFSKYDGLFLDTFGDDNWDDFKSFALDKAKDGAKITYWNNFPTEINYTGFDNMSYEEITVSSSINSYTELADKYYMPKVEL